jgi:hypothetical protein
MNKFVLSVTRTVQVKPMSVSHAKVPNLETILFTFASQIQC